MLGHSSTYQQKRIYIMNKEVNAMLPNKTTTNKNGKVIVTYAVNPYRQGSLWNKLRALKLM